MTGYSDCKTWWDLWWDACHIGTVASDKALEELPIHMANCPVCGQVEEAPEEKWAWDYTDI